MKKIGFVTPWYGEKITGGAEAELRGLVHHMRDAGVDLEVISTCVESFPSDWNVDYHSPGLTEEAGIPVRRFPVRKRDTRAFDAVNLKLMTGKLLTAEDEEIYCREMINSPALCDYLRDHAEEYQAFVFIPYMFGTTYYGCQVCPEKSLLIPFLHDESYAYMNVFRKAFAGVRGMAFHAEPERLLAEKLYGVKGTVISAVDLLKGIGIAAGMKTPDVPGATGYIDTNFEGKAEAAAEALTTDCDFAYVHIEAPDECGHRFEPENKVKSIELIDSRVLPIVIDALEKTGEDYKIMILPDHPTPLATRTHASDPVPYMIYQKSKAAPSGIDSVDEKTAAATGNYIEKGCELMKKFIFE